jgi:GNAT superfamily N-acetyltransferase
MTLTIRPFDVGRDAADVARMFTWNDQFDWSDQDVAHSAAKTPALRLMVEAGGRVVGYGRTCQYAPNPRGSFPTEVLVWPEHQRRGIAKMLLAQLEPHARAGGARCMTGLVHERNPGSLEAVGRLGYAPQTKYYQSFIDATTFEPERFDREVSGYIICALSDLPEGEETDRAYYEAFDEADHETPFMDYFGWLSFDEYRRKVMDPRWFDRKGAFVAIHEGKIVGMSTVNKGSGEFNGQMYVDFTGVLRGHRGRGLATALKVHALAYAKSLGATMVRTENNTDNPAMRAVNKKLGFDERPGMWLVVKEL